MPWKMKDNALEVGSDGNPIWIDDKGKELTVSGTRIPELNAESAANRKRAETAEAKLVAFGDMEPDKARDALAKLALVDQGKLIEAGKLDEAVQAATGQYKTKLQEAETKLTKLQSDVENEKIANAFASSKFIKDRLILPPDMAQKVLADRVKVIDGKAVVIDANGQPLVTSLGEHASLDEGLETLISARADKDTLLRGTNNGGTGNNGNGGNATISKTVTRADLDKMPIEQRPALMKEVREGKAQLVD